MLDNLNYEDYAAQKNTKFHLTESGAELELVEITERKADGIQEMFSLIFRSTTDAFWEQKIYLMRHETLGDGEIFIVPIALDAEGYKYEAAFNRLIKAG